jgi:hypothetical protein
VVVNNGLFTVALDFGKVFHSDVRWLDIQARCPSSSGSYVALSPRQQMTATPYALALPGLHTMMDQESPSIIGGFAANKVLNSDVVGAVIGGGGSKYNCGNAEVWIPCYNQVMDRYGVVGGGEANRAGDNAGDVYDSECATVGGGMRNTASGSHATVGGGHDNSAGGDSATVCGGAGATIPGGVFNTVSGENSFAAGYRARHITRGASF